MYQQCTTAALLILLCCVDIARLETPPVGAIGYFMGNDSQVDHPGWLVCNGSSLSRDEYPELFSAIGRTFTPSDLPTGFFLLPKVTGKIVKGSFDDSDLGEQGGVKNVDITLDHLPQHTHPYPCVNQSGTQPTPPSNGFVGVGSTPLFTSVGNPGGSSCTMLPTSTEGSSSVPPISIRPRSQLLVPIIYTGSPPQSEFPVGIILPYAEVQNNVALPGEWVYCDGDYMPGGPLDEVAPTWGGQLPNLNGGLFIEGVESLPTLPWEEVGSYSVSLPLPQHNHQINCGQDLASQFSPLGNFHAPNNNISRYVDITTVTVGNVTFETGNSGFDITTLGLAPTFYNARFIVKWNNTPPGEPDIPLGTVMPVASHACLTDQGWVEAAGQPLSPEVYPDLFNVLEYTYGDASPEFRILDTRNARARGCTFNGDWPCPASEIAVLKPFGRDAVTPTNNLFAHTHNFTATSEFGELADPNDPNAILGQPSVFDYIYDSISDGCTMHPESIEAAGSPNPTPIPIEPPYIRLAHFIKAKAIVECPANGQSGSSTTLSAPSVDSEEAPSETPGVVVDIATDGSLRHTITPTTSEGELLSELDLSVSFKSLSEVNLQNQGDAALVNTIDLSRQQFILAHSNATINTYKAVISNGAIVEVDFSLSASDEQFYFGIDQYTVPGGALKWSMRIFQWPFQDILHGLSLALSLSSGEGALGDASLAPPEDNITKVYNFGTAGGNVVRVGLLTIATLDGELVSGVDTTKTNDSITITFPGSFQSNLTYDPDFSVLLSEDPDADGGGDGKDDDNTGPIIGGVISGVVVVCCVCAAACVVLMIIVVGLAVTGVSGAVVKWRMRRSLAHHEAVPTM